MTYFTGRAYTSHPEYTELGETKTLFVLKPLPSP